MINYETANKEMIIQCKEGLKQILLAYDDSPHAKAAVQFLESLPLEGSQINALVVLRTQRLSGHEELFASLEDAKTRLEARGGQMKIELKAGSPAATINAYATEMLANLIVMGAKGLRATLGILLGGVAQQVVEYSCCPVLVVRAPYKSLKRVLLVTDGSKYSQNAIEFLAPSCGPDEPGSEGDRRRCFWMPVGIEVHLMHVLPPPISTEVAARAWTVGPEVLYPAPAPPLDKESIEAEEEHQGQAILDHAVDILKAAGIHPNSVMPRGDAATEIMDYIKEQHIDLVVCGSRGLSQVTGWLLGSVSRKLVHYADCSVMIVKCRGEEHKIGLR